MAGKDELWWFGSRAGISDDVPSPWTPVEVKDRGGSIQVSSWGRTYSFGRRAFPEQIESGGAAMLAGPIRILARVDGTAQEWKGEPVRRAGKTPSRADVEQRAVGDHLALIVRSGVGYDGVIRLGWRIEALRSGTLEELVFEVPVKKDHALYYHHFPGNWGVPDAGSVPEGGIHLVQPLLGQDGEPYGNITGFRPFVWPGDNDRGLAWFCESDRNWFADGKNGEKVTEIVPEGDAMVFRLRLVSVPVPLSPEGKTSDQDMMTPLEGGAPTPPGGTSCTPLGCRPRP